MKRTLSDSYSRGQIPTSTNSTRTLSNTQANQAPSVDDWARLPLPPFKNTYDFEGKPVLMAFARDGIDALDMNNENKYIVKGNLQLLAGFCIQNNELQVLTWMMARSGSRTANFSNLIRISRHDIKNIFDWTINLPFKINLDFSHTRLEEYVNELCDGIKRTDNVEELNLTFSFKSEYDIPGDIRFSNTRQSDKSDIFQILCDAIATSASLNSVVTTLDASSVRHFGDLIGKNPGLKKLSIRLMYEWQDTAEAIAHLASGLKLNSNLSDLELLWFMMSDDSLKQIADSLVSKSNLKLVKLYDCGITDPGAILLSKAIRLNNTLQTLELSRNEIDTDGVVAIASALTSNNSLKNLYLSGFWASEEAAEALGAALKSNSNLKTINISGLHVGIQHIADGLAHNSSLEYLNLTDCVIRLQSTLQTIISSAEHHPTLQRLVLPKTYMDLSTMRHLLKLTETRPQLDIYFSLSHWEKSGPDRIARLRQEIIANTPIKEKPEPSQRIYPTHNIVIERIDTTRSRYISTSNYLKFDLTGDDGEVQECALILRDELQIRGPQVYDSELDKVFPIRDPKNPSHVHSDYASDADPRTCAPNIKINEVSFFKDSEYDYNESTLWKILNNLYPKHEFTTQDAFIAALKLSVRREFEAMLRNEAPPSSQRISVVKLNADQCDNEDEARLLQGQYGVVLKDYSAKAQPSIENGEIVCIFAGAKLITRTEKSAYKSAFSNKMLYNYGGDAPGLEDSSKITWAPYGGGNLAQYLNSSFAPNKEGKLTVALAQTNAIMFPIKINFTNKHGVRCSESMLIILQVAPVLEGKQLKLDYGEDYVLTQQEKPTLLQLVEVKEEPVQEH